MTFVGKIGSHRESHISESDEADVGEGIADFGDEFHRWLKIWIIKLI